ncbi:GGDEF domain-containing protein [Alteromonas sp. C1M14]|uniref:GGDEF domain-containing protein n=1 Tax=Alteromonas sp. C1M14 TaxID=2841567 RepID=UPI001C09FB16|nr:GGDEF domain-containing protein [Alteromonas sp. C1M14]MBU2977431.1 GGDEF domain-containing protein [Alteromonas sp. C1M14]
MKSGSLGAGIIILLMAVLLTPVVYADTNDTLEVAFKLRSADPAESSKLLGTLNRDSLTNAQRDKYDFLQAYSKYINNDFEGAVAALEQLAVNASSMDMTMTAKSFLLALSGGVQQWERAFDLIEEILPNIDKLESIDAQESVHIGIINFYLQADEHEMNAQYIKPLLNKPYGLRFKCNAYLQYFGSLLESVPLTITEQMFKEGIAECTDLEEPVIKLALQGMLARFYFYSKDYDKAIAVIDRYLPASENLVYKAVVHEFYELKSRLSVVDGDTKTAQFYALKIIKDSPPDAISISIIEAHKVLYEVAQQESRYKDALFHFKNYFQAKSRNMNSENAKMLAIQKAKQELNDKSLQISLLDKENSLLKTQALLAEQSANNRTLVIFLMLLVLCFMGAWLYTRRVNYRVLQKMARTDGLTGIADRRYFTSAANQIIERAKLENKVVGFIMFDLDDFKSINDQYGHAAGDKALTLCVEAVKKVLRENDLFGRLGGEEFGILLLSCDTSLAFILAEECRQKIVVLCEQENIEYPLSASFGISCSDKCGLSFNSLFECADKALYQAKHSGKNKVKAHH